MTEDRDRIPKRRRAVTALKRAGRAFLVLLVAGTVAICVASCGSRHALSESEVMDRAIPPPDSTTAVVDLYIVSITEVDVIHETFSMLGFLIMEWIDERLTHSLDDSYTYIDREAEDYLNGLWWPDPHFSNQLSRRETQQLVVRVHPDGRVVYDERFLAVLGSDLDLAAFPFDSQTLRIGLKTYALPRDEFALIPGRVEFFSYDCPAGDAECLDSVYSGGAPKQVPVGWNPPRFAADGIEARSVLARSPASGNEYSCIDVAIRLDREEGFYIWRIVLPLFLIAIVSWAGFWMRGESTGSRMTASLFGMLSAVTFGFTVSDSLPKLPDLTFLDVLVTATYCIVALAVFENILAHVLREWKDEALAHRIDRVSRWLYPLLYVASLVGAGLVILT